MTPAEREFNASYYADYGERYDVLRKYSTDGKGDRTINWPLIWGWTGAAIASLLIWELIILGGRAAYAYWRMTR